ncbi:MAG: hypothetical protein ACK48R_12220 [Planctomyces sp.]
MRFSPLIVLTVLSAVAVCSAAAQDSPSAAASVPAPGAPASGSDAQARIDGRAELTAVVGMRAVITQVFFPGTELQPVEGGTTADRDVVVRIDAVYPHGTGFRYDLTWTGFRPGSLNLTRSLRRRNGSSSAELPSLMVTVTSVLPPDRLTLSPTPPVNGRWVGGYRSVMSLLGILWVLGLGLSLWTQKRQRQATSAVSQNPAEQRLQQLRHLLTEAASGTLDPAGRITLEALILAFFREQRGLPEQSPQQLLATLQNDPLAGPLLRQLERWLYDRPGAVQAAVEQLLVPLQQLADQAAAARQTPAGPGSAGATA